MHHLSPSPLCPHPGRGRGWSKLVSRLADALTGLTLKLVRGLFVLMLLVLPVPVGELFHRLLDRRRRAEATEVLKEDES